MVGISYLWTPELPLRIGKNIIRIDVELNLKDHMFLFPLDDGDGMCYV